MNLWMCMRHDILQVNAFLALILGAGEEPFRVLEARDGGALWCFMPQSALILRPGGTISGPSLMTVADTAMYACVLYHYGRVEQAVTQSLNIHFLNRPQPGDLYAHVEALRCGRRSVVLDVRLYAGDAERRVAQASGVYALPSDFMPNQDI